MGFFNRPQQVWFRKVNFQIHLWAGIILALYLTVIGLTGSMLVFGAELISLEHPNPWPPTFASDPIADLATVITNLVSSYPHTHVISVTAPSASDPVFMAVLPINGRLTVACDAVTGRVLGEVPRQHSRYDWIYDLHENLLARRRGRVANGIGALVLLVLSLTGIVNWWPGVHRWRQAMIIDFRRRWRRVNFDVHSAFGFWSFAFLIIWASSGAYFTWPDKCFNLVERISPVVNSKPPAVTVDPNSEMHAPDFNAMLAAARALDPTAKWKEIIFPSSRRSPFQIVMNRAPRIGRDTEDTLYFNPYDGHYISTWKYGINQSVGDWIIYLQIPLHFGTHWGLAVKVIWATFGLSLPVLAVTGLLMYWNRVLSKKWHAFSIARF